MADNLNNFPAAMAVLMKLAPPVGVTVQHKTLNQKNYFKNDIDSSDG